MKIKTQPTFGGVPSVSKWVVPPLEFTPTRSAVRKMLQIMDGLMKRWTVDLFSNRIQIFLKLSAPVHHVEVEVLG